MLVKGATGVAAVNNKLWKHYNDVIMGAIASQITSLTIVYSTVYSDADQRKHQSSVSLAFVQGIHRRTVNSPHKWPVTRKIFPFDDVIMNMKSCTEGCLNLNPSTWCDFIGFCKTIKYGLLDIFHKDDLEYESGGGGVKNTYELLNLRVCKISILNKTRTFQLIDWLISMYW